MPVAAEGVVERFREWLYVLSPKPNDLHDALYYWLHEVAVREVGGDYSLYLQSVVLIIAEWVEDRSRFICRHGGKEKALDQLAPLGADWGLLERELFELHVFEWQHQYRIEPWRRTTCDAEPAEQAGSSIRPSTASS